MFLCITASPPPPPIYACACANLYHVTASRSHVHVKCARARERERFSKTLIVYLVVRICQFFSVHMMASTSADLSEVLLTQTKQTKRKATSAATTTAAKKRKQTKSESATTTTTAKKRGRGRPPANNGFGSGKKAIANVHKLLSDLGVERPASVSSCLKAALLNGFVTLKRPADDPEGKFGLDQVVVTGDCLCCNEKDLTCRIRDILYQPDYGGCDYEDGGEEAPLKCSDEHCGIGIYVTGLCNGSPAFDSGKFHNHCQSCPLFGVCIGDYREVHCDRCGSHYYAGGMGGSCYNCKGKGKGKKKTGGGGGGRRWCWVHVSDTVF